MLKISCFFLLLLSIFSPISAQTIQDSFEGNWQDKTVYDDVIDWYCKKMPLFYKAVYPIWKKVQGKLD